MQNNEAWFKKVGDYGSHSYILVYRYPDDFDNFESLLQIADELNKIFDVQTILSTHYNRIIIPNDSFELLRKIKEYLDFLFSKRADEK